MSDKFIVTVNKVTVDKLPEDQLDLPELPEALNSVTESLAPNGSLDLQLVYLLNAEQCERAVKSLEANSVRYPRRQPVKNAAKVINLSAHRNREQP
jgi:tRNA A58 N-methylase Trm61